MNSKYPLRLYTFRCDSHCIEGLTALPSCFFAFNSISSLAVPLCHSSCLQGAETGALLVQQIPHAIVKLWPYKWHWGLEHSSNPVLQGLEHSCVETLQMTLGVGAQHKAAAFKFGWVNWPPARTTTFSLSNTGKRGEWLRQTGCRRWLSWNCNYLLHNS